MKKIVFLFLVFFILKCTGTYYGIDGKDVIPRSEALSRINTALVIKFANCGFTNTNLTLLSRNFTQSDRKILDGAYYTTKDIDSCVQTIYLNSCVGALTPCNLSPKDFFGGGGLFQGGF